MSKQQLFNTLPFVVVTRSSDKLMESLLRDTYPILFEGLHSCFHLGDERLTGRLKVVRTHNIEHDYYRNLQKVERSVFKKMYFGMEGKKLERFESILKKADHIAAISAADTEQLSKRYKNVHHITAFHPNEKVEIEEGNGRFCLYHGNLEVGENNEAALFLVNQVFSKISIPFVIAGRKPSEELKMAVTQYAHISLKANINTNEIHDLISKAQINVLPTFQATGIKLKLLAALFTGRYCVVNTPMVANTGLENLCAVHDNAGEMAAAISKLFTQAFDMNEKKKREEILLKEFSNTENAKKLIALI
jgi:hypothetical protein